jgi:predicted nuclease of predicted toxin-antitoxin system
MKIKLDENLPARLATRLGLLGHRVQTVREEGMEGHLDETIWEVAQSESRFLITQDMDFSDARRYAPGSHHGILLIRLRTPKRRALIRRVEDLFRQEDVSQWDRCLVLATESKVRVRRPAKLP